MARNLHFSHEVHVVVRIVFELSGYERKKTKCYIIHNAHVVR